MKATGFIRRIDDLGRIVIPREIRGQLGIQDYDQMEVFVDANNRGVYLRKFNVCLEEKLNQFNSLVCEYGNCDHEQLDQIYQHVEEIKKLLKEEKS